MDASIGPDLSLTNWQIVFDRVSFGDGNTDEILRNRSLTIALGGRVALIDISFLGNPTLVSLLMRYLRYFLLLLLAAS